MCIRDSRYSFNATMKLDITDWMSLTGRIRTDNATINYTRKLSASTNTLFASKYGSYLNRTMTHNNLYGDVLLSIDKSFFDNAFSLQFNLGASIMDDKNQLTGYEGYLAGIPNKFTYNNIISDNSQSFPTQENYHDQIQAVYATMQLGWRGMLYVDVSVRNDWASMLAFTPKQNIFYPSVGLSAVISSMADLSKAGISFLKVRGSYAEVGNAPERYITGPNYTLTNGVVSTATIAPAKHLEAERTKSFEAGLDVKFLGNKISATATYYNTNTYNQLFLYDAPPSSGYKQKYINAGKVNNWGIEASAGYKNTWRDFSWVTTLNFSMNRNKIKELVPEGTRDPDTGSLVDIKEVNKDYGGYRVKLVEGGSIGDFYVKGLLTDDKGHIYVDPNSNTCLLYTSETCGDALVVEHNGDVYSCDHFVYPEYKLGNIAQTPLDEIYRTAKRREFGLNKRNTLPTECLRCKFYFACRGECPKHRFDRGADGSPKNSLCEGLKIYFRHVEPYMEYMRDLLSKQQAPAWVMPFARKRMGLE